MTHLAKALLLALVASSGAHGQTNAAHESPWTLTLNGGAFLFGNKHAVTSWLRQNSYGAAEPPRCVFDLLLNRTCSTSEAYPQVTGSSFVAAMISARRRVSDKWSVELYASGEQSGTAKGRCDNLAVPRDPRCTDRFIDVDFGGLSVASLAALALPHVQLSAGPALFFATWQMEPSNVPGLWFDATTRLGSWPWVARAQYRLYRSVTLDPNGGFSSFHASSLFLGVGFVTAISNSP